MILTLISDECAPENFDTFLETVNKNLRSLFMEIRHGISEEDGSKNYGLVRKLNTMVQEAIFSLATCNATIMTKKHCKSKKGGGDVFLFCNTPGQLEIIILKSPAGKMGKSDWLIFTKLCCKL